MICNYGSEHSQTKFILYTNVKNLSDGVVKVQSQVVPMLQCLEHGYADGLRASPEGLLHGVS